MEKMPDYHVHTSFSCDSEATMEAICRVAVAQGMREVAFTDHVDFEPLDPCCDHFRPDGYWRAIEAVRAASNGQLTIRAGIECGEGHLYRAQIAALLAEGEYDVVIGSIHWIAGRMALHPTFFDGRDLDEGVALYLDDLLRLAAEADYDVLGHFDIVRRAAYRRFKLRELDLTAHEASVRRVLRTVAERGKGIEVNTSYCRRKMGEPGPSLQVLRWFRQEGGQIVTLGSDAHQPEDVGADFDRALALVRQAGFDHLTAFSRRTPVSVALDKVTR